MNLRYFNYPKDFHCTCPSCKGTKGGEKMDRLLLKELDELRDLCGFPFIVTSAYRCPQHPEEASKPSGPGQHAWGRAVDIAVSNGHQRRLLVDGALEMGFGGIGVAKTFVHVDNRDGAAVLWTY